MAVTAEQLNIILSAKDKQFNDALKRSQRQVDFFAKNLKGNLAKQPHHLTGLAELLRC